MKAIYINLDPYLQAVADWLNAGKPGTAPSFDPLPVAVTIPLGQSVGIYCPGYSGDEPASFLVDGLEMLAQAQGDFDPSTGTNIVSDITPGFSAFPHGTTITTQYYAVKEVAGSKMSYTAKIGEYDEGDIATVTFTVLVRREQASGPVDLVDFTPPAASPTADAINAALGGTGALEDEPLNGVRINGMRYLIPGAEDTSSISSTTPDPASVSGGSDILTVSTPGS